jgi:hypothetical protein
MSYGEFPNTVKAFGSKIQLDQTFLGSTSFNYNNGLVVGTIWIYHLFDTPVYDIWYGYAEFLQNLVPSGYVEFSIPFTPIQGKQLGNNTPLMLPVYKGHVLNDPQTGWINFRNGSIFMRVYQNNMFAVGANPL